MELLQPLLDEKAEELRAAGRKPYVVAPMGLESLSLGAVGYVQAALELDAQLEAQDGIDPDWLVVCGANMTPAGLALGLKALGRRIRLDQHRADPVERGPRATDIARIGNATAERLGLDTRLAADEIENHDDYIGAALRRGHRCLPRGAAAGRRRPRG